MLQAIRRSIVQTLWQRYLATNPPMQKICAALAAKSSEPLVLDHFAIIDLPSAQSGIQTLTQLFTLLGYQQKGQDYLASKQNDFCWLAEEGCEAMHAKDVLPQAVVADFRLDELPQPVRCIIEKYAAHTKACPFVEIEALLAHLDHPATAPRITQLIGTYLTGRDWPLPTVNEFRTVRDFNELLAWVLIFGRIPNHFTVSLHLLSGFTDIADFLCFIENNLHLPLNHEGGLIKGDISKGISQASTTDLLTKVTLQDGEIELPLNFVEFVWRHPKPHLTHTPERWDDYFPHFIGQHADRVIESLYLNEKKDNLCKIQG